MRTSILAAALLFGACAGDPKNVPVPPRLHDPWDEGTAGGPSSGTGTYANDAGAPYDNPNGPAPVAKLTGGSSGIHNFLTTDVAITSSFMHVAGLIVSNLNIVELLTRDGGQSFWMAPPGAEISRVTLKDSTLAVQMRLGPNRTIAVLEISNRGTIFEVKSFQIQGTLLASISHKRIVVADPSGTPSLSRLRVYDLTTGSVMSESDDAVQVRSEVVRPLPDRDAFVGIETSSYAEPGRSWAYFQYVYLDAHDKPSIGGAYFMNIAGSFEPIPEYVRTNVAFDGTPTNAMLTFDGKLLDASTESCEAGADPSTSQCLQELSVPSEAVEYDAFAAVGDNTTYAITPSQDADLKYNLIRLRPRTGEVLWTDSPKRHPNTQLAYLLYDTTSNALMKCILSKVFAPPATLEWVMP